MMTELEKLKVALEVVSKQRDEALNAIVWANVEIVSLRKQLEAAKPGQPEPDEASE